jgi:hypothetical protein
LDQLDNESTICEREEFCILGPSTVIELRKVRGVLTIFSERAFQSSSPMALYCLTLEAIRSGMRYEM